MEPPAGSSFVSFCDTFAAAAIGKVPVEVYIFTVLSTMGGGGWYYVPKVWSPAGGWWSNPVQWKRNTGIAFAVVGVCAFGIFQVSAAKERRPVPPRIHIPSQNWARHAIEDDPSLAKR